MKRLTFLRYTFLLFALASFASVDMYAQNIAEFEGVTEIKVNSTTGVPHLRLVEEDASTEGSTRIFLQHTLNTSDQFELRAFPASSQQRMGWYFNGNGRVVYNETLGGLGIGTTNPEASLHTNGNGLFEHNSSGTSPGLEIKETQNNDFSRLFFTNSFNTANKWSVAANLGTTAEKAIGWFYDGIARVYYSESEGGLGVGTTNPTQLLHLNFTGSDGIRVQGDGTGDARGVFMTNGGGSHYIFDDASDNNNMVIQSANDLIFWTDGVNERMKINKVGGEVSINGGGSVSSTLGVLSTDDFYGIRADNESTGIAYSLLGISESNGTSSKYGVFGSIDGTSGTGSSYGVRGFANTTPANYWAVYAAGDLWYSGSIKAPSDERLKKNIQDLDPVLSKVLQLETKTYEFDRERNVHLNLASGPQIGFIAQNVQSLFPTLVEEEKHTYEVSKNEETGEVTEGETSILGMSSIEMIPILTKAIQEQQVLIEELRADLEALKSEK